MRPPATLAVGGNSPAGCHRRPPLCLSARGRLFVAPPAPAALAVIPGPSLCLLPRAPDAVFVPAPLSSNCHPEPPSLPGLPGPILHLSFCTHLTCPQARHFTCHPQPAAAGEGSALPPAAGEQQIPPPLRGVGMTKGEASGQRLERQGRRRAGAGRNDTLESAPPKARPCRARGWSREFQFAATLVAPRFGPNGSSPLQTNSPGRTGAGVRCSGARPACGR